MALTLMQAIHGRWAADTALCALLPASRVSTGTAPGAALPLAVIVAESDRPLAACNDGSTVRSVGVQIVVLHGSYAVAATIVEQVTAAFDLADFDLDDGRVIDMRKTNGSEQQQQDDGVWRMVVDFTCMVHYSRKAISWPS